MKFVCRFLNTARLVGAVAEAPDQVANAERDGGGRIGALLDRGTQEIASLAASFADRFRCVGGGLLRLAVYFLQRPFHLPCLTLDLRFHITGRSPESFLHLSTNVFGSPAETIFIHGHSPPEFKVKPAAAGIRSSSGQPQALRGSLLPLCSASELTAFILLVAPARRLAAARPFHSNGGGENAEGEQRNELAPADGAAPLDRTRTQLRVEPNPLFARGERHLGPFDGSTPRLQTANDCDDRDHEEQPGEYRRRE